MALRINKIAWFAKGMAQEAVLIILSAFVPCALFAALARWTEVSQRQSLRSVFTVFLLGATISVVLALLLEVGSQFLLTEGLGIDSQSILSAFIGAAVLAPIIEEYTKATPVRGIRYSTEFSEVEEPVDRRGLLQNDPKPDSKARRHAERTARLRMGGQTT